MSLSRIGRFLVIAGTVLCGVIGVEFWIAPDHAAHRFGLEAIRSTGLTALRADLGGLFIALAALSGIAAWTRRRAWIVSAGMAFAAVAIGRAISWIAQRGSDGDGGSMLIELGMIASLAALARSSAPRSTVEERRILRPAIAVAILVVAATGVSAALFSPSVQQTIFDRAAQKRTATINSAPLADGALRVAVCGSSAPLPSERRAKTCAAVFAGGKFYIVDIGPESTENLVLWGIPLSEIGGVLLTHFHSDHIGDLGELNLQTWAGGRPAPLPVYGGPGVEEIVEGFNRAYRLDQGYRTRHHTERVMPPATWPMIAHRVEVDGPESPAKNRTPSMTRALGNGARDAGRDGTAAIMHDIEDYHITPEQAARIANDAQVKLLAFYHLLPAPDGLLTRRLFSQGIADARQGDWTIADDGSLYTLPLGSTDVHIGRIDE